MVKDFYYYVVDDSKFGTMSIVCEVENEAEGINVCINMAARLAEENRAEYLVMAHHGKFAMVEVLDCESTILGCYTIMASRLGKGSARFLTREKVVALAHEWDREAYLEQLPPYYRPDYEYRSQLDKEGEGVVATL